MSILVVAGEPGNGKGVLAMSLLEQAVRMGRPVLTNVALLPACPFYDHVALIDTDDYPVLQGTPDYPYGDEKKGIPAYRAFWHYTPPGSFVLIDEADLYFDCTDHSSLGRDVKAFLKQHRKLGMDLVFVVQSIENLYVRIRRLAQRFIVCEWTFRSMKVFENVLVPVLGRERALLMSRFIRSEFGSQTLVPSSHLGDGHISYREAREKYFNWYVTEQLLGDLSHLKWMDSDGNTKGTIEAAG